MGDVWGGQRLGWGRVERGNTKRAKAFFGIPKKCERSKKKKKNVD